MTGYRFDLTCPQCGSDVTHTASGTVTAGTHTTATAQCPSCRRRFQLTLTLRPWTLT